MALPRGTVRLSAVFMIVVFPDHTHYFFHKLTFVVTVKNGNAPQTTYTSDSPKTHSTGTYGEMAHKITIVDTIWKCLPHCVTHGNCLIKYLLLVYIGNITNYLLLIQTGYTPHTYFFILVHMSKTFKMSIVCIYYKCLFYV